MDSLTNLDTLLGVALGVLTVAYLWNRAGEAAEALKGSASDEDERNRKTRERNYTPAELALFDGKEGRLAYVALREPEDGVYDVTNALTQYAADAGHEVGQGVDQDVIKAKFPRVGKLIRPREWTVDEIVKMDGREGRPIFIAAKGEVFDVTRGADFYGPEGGYSMMAGRDASRALALVSLDPKDIENNRIDDLPAADIMTLDEWRFKFHSKYTCVGTLKGWTPAGSPLPSALAAARGGAAAATPASPAPAAAAAAAAADAPTFLTKERQRVMLGEKIQLSHDSFLFRFTLPQKNMRLGLPIGKHVKFWCPNPKPKVQGEWNGRPDPEADKTEVERKYTPSSLDSEPSSAGHFDVVIKVYRPNDKFCDGGKMSQYFGDLKVGDYVDVAGPFGLIEYKGNGDFIVQKKPLHTQFLGLMAGGTGVTPMLQLIKAIMLDPNDTTKVSLIFANQTEEDILCRDLLEDLQKKNPDRFRLHYTLDRPPQGWKYSSGFITAEMIQAQLPPPGNSTFICVCGPPPMVKFACKANLEKLGYPMDRVAEF